MTARVRACVPAESLALIDATPARGWIPLEHDHHVPTSIVAQLGPVRAQAYFRWLLRRQLESPLLRSTLRATQKMFGLSPAALLRAVPLGWPIVYRDFCSPRVTGHSADQATIRLERVDPRVLEHPAYLESFAGFFSGFFDACSVEGTVTVRVKPSRGVEITLHW